MRSVADGGSRSHRVKVACNPFTCIQSVDNKLALYSHQKPSSSLVAMHLLSQFQQPSLFGISHTRNKSTRRFGKRSLSLSLSQSDRALHHLSPLLAGAKHRHYCLIHLSLSLSLSLSVKRKQYDSNWNIAKQKIWTPQDTEVERKSNTQQHAHIRARARTHRTTEREK